MGTHHSDPVVVDEWEINGHKLTVERITWEDGGLSFDAYLNDDECLTSEESMDSQPDRAVVEDWAADHVDLGPEDDEED